MHNVVNPKESRNNWPAMAAVIALILTLVLIGFSLQAQTKSLQEHKSAQVLPVPVLWLHPGQEVLLTKSNGSTAGYAANYALAGQADFRQQIINGYHYAQAQTIALVVVPRFDTASGAAFMRMGQVALYDNYSRNGQQTKEHAFKKDQPVILVFRCQGLQAYGKATPTHVEFVDEALFDIAELWITNSLLTDDQTRHLETYLALKHAVNISRNKQERYRSYFTAEDHLQWYSPTEGRYSQHILGLGRMDAFGWYQTQTQTNPQATAPTFTLALDAVMPRGTLKDVALADNSYLILAKATAYDNSLCPTPKAALPFYGWKLKRTAWQSPATHVHFTATLAEAPLKSANTDTVLLTNGQVDHYLPVFRQGKTWKLAIPLALLADGTNYFLLPTQSNTLCEEKIKVVADSTNNTLGIAISPEQLPLQVQINGLSNQSTNTYVLTNPYSLLSTGSNGSYQLDFYSHNGTLGYSTTVSLNGSASGTAGVNGYNTLNEIGNPRIKSAWIAQAEGSNLLAYPNPATENSEVTFQLLNPTPGEYSIRVADQGGKLLHQHKHYFDPENTSWNYTFATPGAYTVVYTLGNTTFSQTIIIQSS